MLHLHFGKEVQIHQVITNFPMPIEWIRLKPWHQTLVLNIPSPLELLSLASNTKMESLLLPIQWEITEDIADFQYLHNIIESKQNEEDICGKGGVTMRPEALHCWLTRVLYNRRSKFDPLWNTIIVGGIQDGKPFLGCVDHIGTAWKENAVATGMGAAMAIPIINHELEKYDNSTDNLNFEQARDIMMKCLRVSYLRDCRATNKFHISVVNKDGAKVEGPLTIDSNWEVAKMIKGYD